MSTQTPAIADTFTATDPGGELELAARFLADDPAVWRPAHDELLARVWPRPVRRPAQPATGNDWAMLTLAPLETRDEAPQALGITKTRHSGSCGVCGSCGAALAVPRRGPQPSYCSRACRTRAWRARSVDTGPRPRRWPT